MATELIDILRRSFTEKSYQDVSKHIGITEASTRNGLNALVPIVLASLLEHYPTGDIPQPKWWNVLKECYPYSDKEYIETDHIKDPEFLIRGREITSGLYQSNHDDLVATIGNVAGVSKEKAAGIVEVGVPLIVGYLNNWMKRKNWSFSQLMGNLYETKGSIKNALPTGVSYVNIDTNHVPPNTFSKTNKTVVPTQNASPRRIKNSFLWLFGLIVVVLVLWYVMGFRSCNRTNVIDEFSLRTSEVENQKVENKMPSSIILNHKPL